MVIDMHKPQKWVRSNGGWICGVCEGLGKNLGIEPNLLRLLWVLAIFGYGTGALLYLLMAFVLPVESDSYAAYNKRFLGVCARIAKRNGMDIGLVRLIAVLSLFFSFGMTLLVYLGLHFLYPKENTKIYY